MEDRYPGLNISSSDEGADSAEEEKLENDAARLSDPDVHSEAPAPAAIARSRSPPSNVSPAPQKRRDERTLKKKSVLGRVSEFPEEMLERRDGRLFCSACRERIREKKSNVYAHVQSKKHTAAKQTRQGEKMREVSMTQALQKWDKEKRPVGETLPLQVRAYRLNVVRTLMKEAMPLKKADGLPDLLEKDGLRLTTSSHLTEFIPVVLSEEQDTFKKKIAGRDVALIFDGTTRLGEAIAIVLRYVGDDWKIQQRLVRLQTVSKSVNSPQLAQVLNECVSVRYGVPHKHIIASMRDGAAVNGAAMRTLSILFPSVLDVTCFSHTLSNTGRHFQFATHNEVGHL
eukprot:scpid83935/ scgid14881/ 